MITKREKSPYDLGMKWYKFLIYFVFILGPILNILSGIIYVLGLNYGDNADFVYRAYPGLKEFDLFCGALIIFVGLFQFCTRSSLKKFRYRAPKMVTISYVLLLISNLIVTFGPTFISSDFAAAGVQGVASSVVGPLVFLIYNHSYFKKREHMFVN